MTTKYTYIVAGNAFTVTAPEGLPAWEALKPRYAVFEDNFEFSILNFELSSASEAPNGSNNSNPSNNSERSEKIALEVEIKHAPLPEHGGEPIYQPEFGGIGVISSRASRLADGSLVMEFKHIKERRPRIAMTMPPAMNRAEIMLSSEDDEATTRTDDGNDLYFLTHAVMIAYLLATAGNGTLLIHSSAVIYGGKAYLFQGKSGTGKSTHAALWTRHVEGATLLNDDHPVIRLDADGTPRAYGSPWSGKTDCYRRESAPIGAIVRIMRAGENELRRLAPLQAYASLTASVFSLPFFTEAQRAARHAAIERLAMTVPCCEMHCRPDADAARTCRDGLTAL